MLARTAFYSPQTMGMGPWGTSHTIEVVGAPIVDIACDAYMLFHPTDGVARFGVAQSIIETGGAPGVSAYEAFLTRHPGKRQTGALHITESGGGNSRHLLNVVDGFHRLPPEELAGLGSMISYAFTESHHRALDRIAIPPIGISKTDGFAADKSAMLLLGAIRQYWQVNPLHGPHHITIATNGNEALQRAYESILWSSFEAADDMNLLRHDDYRVAMKSDDVLQELMAGLEDAEDIASKLRGIKSVIEKGSATAGLDLIDKLVDIVKRAPELSVRPGMAIRRESIPPEWEAIRVLTSMAKLRGSIGKMAGVSLARLGSEMSEKRAARNLQ